MMLFCTADQNDFVLTGTMAQAAVGQAERSGSNIHKKRRASAFFFYRIILVAEKTPASEKRIILTDIIVWLQKTDRRVL